MGSKTNLSWVNDPTLYGGTNLGDTTVTANNPFRSRSIGFDNIQGPTIPTSMPSDIAPLNTSSTIGTNVNNSVMPHNNSITGNQIAGVVSGGSQMLNSWFQNMDKPIEAPTTSDQTINGYGYTKINSINNMFNGEGAGSAALSGAASGASAGAAFGPLGAGIGAGVGAIGGFVSNLFGNKKRNSRINAINNTSYGQTDYNRSQAQNKYLNQQYTENSTFADGGMYLSTIITDMMAKMRNNDINNHNLNNFFTGGMFIGTQLNPETLTGRLSRNKFAKGGLVRYTPIEQKDTDNSYNKPSKLHGKEYSSNIVPQLANTNAFNTPNAWVNKKETIMSQNGNIDSVDDNNPNMLKVHNGEDGYLASLQDGDMILSDNIKVPGTNKTFAQKGKSLEMLMNKVKEPTYNNVSDNTNKLNAQNAMNEYKQLFELQQQLKFNKK